jgi:tetratricopeptide (TPR) repeat protein
MHRLVKFLLLVALLATSVAPAWADAFHTRLREVNVLLEQGLFDEATKALDEMKVDYPDRPVLDYALGSAQYQRAEGLSAAGKPAEALSAYKDAETRFSGISPQADAKIALAAAFGRANAMAQQAKMAASPDKYKEAITALRNTEAAYQDVIKRDPAYPGAQQNLDHIRLMLKQMLQNPPQSQENGEQQQPPEDQKKQPKPKLISVFRGATTQLPGATAVADGATVTLKPGAAAQQPPAGAAP